MCYFSCLRFKLGIDFSLFFCFTVMLCMIIEIPFLLSVLIILLTYIINVPIFLFQAEIMLLKKGLHWFYVNFDFIELCSFSITFGCSFPYLYILDIQKTLLRTCMLTYFERHRGGWNFPLWTNSNWHAEILIKIIRSSKITWRTCAF